MKTLASIMFVFVSLIYLPLPASALSSPAEFQLLDTSGSPHSLQDYRGKYLVLEWLNYDCPFVRKHYDSGNMQKLQTELTDQGVVWLAVVSSALGKQGNYPAQEMADIGRNKKSRASAVLLDESGEIGRLYGARTTPQMFLISPEGDLLYQGAIDDKASANQQDIAGAHNYLLTAYHEASTGKPVTNAKTQPYGCSVKY